MAESVVTGAFIDGRRIFLCHRSPGRRWYPDVWDLPGGHVELGETPTEALERELLEELGVSVCSLPPEPLMRLTHGRRRDLHLVRRKLGRYALQPRAGGARRHRLVHRRRADGLGMAHPSYLDLFRATPRAPPTSRLVHLAWASVLSHAVVPMLDAGEVIAGSCSPRPGLKARRGLLCARVQTCGRGGRVSTGSRRPAFSSSITA